MRRTAIITVAALAVGGIASIAIAQQASPGLGQGGMGMHQRLPTR